MDSASGIDTGSRLKLLEILAESAGSFISSTQIIQTLGCTRQAVFKLVSALRDEGLPVLAQPQKGYCINDLNEINTMSRTLIDFLLKGNCVFSKCIYLPEVDSTQHIIKKLAAQDAPEGIVAVTDMQTNGRGRRGRQWEDAGGKNLIFSVLLRPRLKPSEVQLLNLAAGLAVRNTMNEHYGLHSELKWPNDTLINGRKICGILSEAACETDRIYYAATGVGVNVNISASNLTDDIKSTATSMLIETGTETARPLLLARILSSFSELIIMLSGKDGAFKLIDYYRKNCATIGKEIKVIQDGDTFTGRAVGVTEQGALIANVKGEQKIFAAADVQHLRNI